MSARLILGDALTVLPTLEAGSVDCVITDPPYGTGQWVRPDEGAGSDCSAVQVVEAWDVWRTDWLDDAARVARHAVGLFCPQWELPSLLSWIGDRRWRMFLWCKSDPRPRFAGQPAWGFDPFVVIGKVQPCSGTDWFEASSPRMNRDREAAGHPHQKRGSLMRWLVSLCCPPGGKVLDPFAGSGTTLVAALLTGRNAIGIEIDPAYHAIAQRRIDEVDAIPPLVQAASLFDAQGE